MYQNSPNFTIRSGISPKSHPKCENHDFWWSGLILVIPELISPLQNLCNSLGFSWSGQVSCVPWGARTDFWNFSAIYWKCWNSHKIMESLEISGKFKHFSKFSGFCIFRAIDPPKPLINDKEYWCFCKPVDFAEFMIFIKKAKICEEITFSNFVIILWKSHFLRKWAPGHQKPLKRDGIALVL